MLASFPGDGPQIRPVHRTSPLAWRPNLLKLCGRDMVALIHNHMAICHEIVDRPLRTMLVISGYIKQAGCFVPAATDPANSARRHSDEGGMRFDPYEVWQLPPMYQYECIHSPVAHQSRCGPTVFPNAVVAANTLPIMGEQWHARQRFARGRTPLECRFQWQPGLRSSRHRRCMFRSDRV